MVLIETMKQKKRVGLRGRGGAASLNSAAGRASGNRWHVAEV